MCRYDWAIAGGYGKGLYNKTSMQLKSYPSPVGSLVLKQRANNLIIRKNTYKNQKQIIWQQINQTNNKAAANCTSNKLAAALVPPPID